MLQNLRHTFSSLGRVNALYYLVGRALNKLHPRLNLFRYYLVAQPIAQNPRLTGTQGATIVVRPIESGDPALGAMQRPPKVIQQRYAQGAVCLGAFKADQLIGFIWLQFGPYLEDEVRCRFIPGPEGQAVWDFDVFVDPKYRIGFAFARLWDAADTLLRSRGVRWSVSRISAFNVTSLTAHRKLGLHTVGRGTFWIFGNLQVSFSTLAPYVHFSWSEKHVPTLYVDAQPIKQ